MIDYREREFLVKSLRLRNAYLETLYQEIKELSQSYIRNAKDREEFLSYILEIHDNVYCETNNINNKDRKFEKRIENIIDRFMRILSKLMIQDPKAPSHTRSYIKLRHFWCMEFMNILDNWIDYAYNLLY